MGLEGKKSRWGKEPLRWLVEPPKRRHCIPGWRSRRERRHFYLVFAGVPNTCVQ